MSCLVWDQSQQRNTPNLGIENLQDLLLYFPFRYEDFKTKQVLELEDGEKAVLSGQVGTPASVQYYGFKRNRLRF